MKTQPVHALVRLSSLSPSPFNVIVLVEGTRASNCRTWKSSERVHRKRQNWNLAEIGAQILQTSKRLNQKSTPFEQLQKRSVWSVTGLNTFAERSDQPFSLVYSPNLDNFTLWSRTALDRRPTADSCLEIQIRCQLQTMQHVRCGWLPARGTFYRSKHLYTGWFAETLLARSSREIVATEHLAVDGQVFQIRQVLLLFKELEQRV